MRVFERFGRLFDGLERRGLLKDTLVVLTSDGDGEVDVMKFGHGGTVAPDDADNAFGRRKRDLFPATCGPDIWWSGTDREGASRTLERGCLRR